MENYPEEFIDWIIQSLQLNGYSILLVTIPLALIQAFVGLYPFAALIMLNISAIGLAEGLLASWVMGTLGTIVVYVVCERFLSDWIKRKWLKKMKRYEKWQKYTDHYGVWAIIVLRTLPVMPNNLICLMASVSSISFGKYCWSCVWGMLSYIGLIGILGSAVFMPEINVGLLIGIYIAFCAVLLIVFMCQQLLFVKHKGGAGRGAEQEPPSTNHTA
ncbi:TVP38/TMEM64 family protein [Paenibacillus pinistramenti]|uniref:TVP38/TMEM64 family protein n=1 Tax=Paenibacillus pinistramenti TaxID=1768003 RepID=UPI001109D9E2|nr:VTT domain-containing protein [Paenibacillus pinistramenti]